MRYDTMESTFQVRQVTPAELNAGEVVQPDQPEFLVHTSPVGNGWWTRQDLAALHARLGELLATPAPGNKTYSLRVETG